MTHIVFQEADIAVLHKAMELDESLQGEIILIKDDLAVGPLQNIYETEGYQQRRDWWKMLLEFSPYTDSLNVVDDKLTVHNLLKQLNEDASTEVWIWMGQNAHDVCGYYWLIPLLKNFHGRIYILYLNNLPFINEKGNIFYPTALYEIQPKEFLKAKKLARLVTLSEFEVDPDEWKKLCDENATVRILEGGKKIVSANASYYDAEILKAVNGEPQKLSKIFSTLFGKMKVKTGDVFLAWRMRELIKEGKLELVGDWENGWKEVALKMAGEIIAEMPLDQ